MAKGSGGAGRGGRTIARPRVGSIVIPVINGRPSPEFAIRVTQQSGGRIIGVGVTARPGTLAARPSGFPLGTRFIQYTGTLSGDRQRDTLALSRFGQ